MDGCAIMKFLMTYLTKIACGCMLASIPFVQATETVPTDFQLQTQGQIQTAAQTQTQQTKHLQSTEEKSYIQSTPVLMFMWTLVIAELVTIGWVTYHEAHT